MYYHTSLSRRFEAVHGRWSIAHGKKAVACAIPSPREGKEGVSGC